MTWNDGFLDASRLEGDPFTDALAGRLLGETTFSGKPGRLGYHHLLDLADRLLEAPELYLAKDSQLARELAQVPEEFRAYFDPVLVPDWVDADKLAIASRVWDENMMAIIWVLYAASLPSCYLIAKGIPTLYESGKLAQDRYIYQRIYETGLMLEAVMEPGGLTIVNDLSIDAQLGPRRFVWGRGVIAARKVRMLHSVMRYLLLNPRPVAEGSGEGATRMRGLPPFDVTRYGLPVNQEDLAYTLLTFGYVIPAGLRTWGCRLSGPECEAFLHAWRLVAHLMGVKQELVPTSWFQAQELFNTIQARQKAHSRMAETLTSALQGFLRQYLPPMLRRDLPGLLIASQLGKAQARLILPAGTSPVNPFTAALFACALLMVTIYYSLRSALLRTLPSAGVLLGATFRMAGNAVVDSWRDDYQRRPFYLPQSADAAWTKQAGIDESTTRRLHVWRGQLFYAVVLGITCIVAATLLGGVWLVLLALRMTGLLDGISIFSWRNLALMGTATGCAFILGLMVLHAMVRYIVIRRPGPPAPGIQETATHGAVRRQRVQR